MKALIIKLSFLAAFIFFIVFAAGIEGGASFPACATGMSVCLGWMGLVAYANSEMIKRKRDV